MINGLKTEKKGFNPRSYVRSDTKGLCRHLRKFQFQSTLLREERHYGSRARGSNQRFQSTLLREERHNAICSPP